MRRLKETEIRNECVRRTVFDLMLNKLIVTGAAKGLFRARLAGGNTSGAGKCLIVAAVPATMRHALKVKKCLDSLNDGRFGTHLAFYAKCICRR